MLKLTKENLSAYLSIHMDSKRFAPPYKIIPIGEGELEKEIEGDGIVNFLFRVEYADGSIIVKQGREFIKNLDYYVPLTPKRNFLEYETLKLRNNITPEYVPEIYFIDQENNIFVMEDVSNLKIMRFQLNQNVQFPNFPVQFAQFLAYNHFYTSEYYLETGVFRRLGTAFINSEMRSIMESLFLNELFEKNKNADEPLKIMGSHIWSNEAVLLEAHRMRTIYMSKVQCLVHGDLHTSNIFLNQDHMKIIDMEYTCLGPFSYDLGYFMANLISQYACVCYRTYANEADRIDYQKHLVYLITSCYNQYKAQFIGLWKKDAKTHYKNAEKLSETLFEDILAESIGMAACANISRITHLYPHPDFTMLEENLEQRNHALRTSLLICEFLLLNRTAFSSIEEVAEKMELITKTYTANL